jgi:hypothetical protein
MGDWILIFNARNAAGLALRSKNLMAKDCAWSRKPAQSRLQP